MKKVDASNGKPLSDVEFLVTDSTGAVVGDANGKFVTDSSGSFLVENIAPNTTLVVKETRAKANAIKLTPEKTLPLKIVGEVDTTRKQTQKAASGFLGLPTFQRFSRDG